MKNLLASLCVCTLPTHQTRTAQSIVLVAALLAQAAGAHAANPLWFGSQSSDWSDPLNWSTGEVPTRFDDDINFLGQDVAFFRADSVVNNLIIDEVLTSVDLPFALQIAQLGQDATVTIDTGGELISSLPGEAAQIFLGSDSNGAAAGGDIGTGTLNVTGTGSYLGILRLGEAINFISQSGGTGVVKLSGSGSITTNPSWLSVAGPGSHINITGGGLLVGGVFGVLNEGGFATMSGGGLTIISDDNTDQSGLVNNLDNTGWIRASNFGSGATIQAVYNGTNTTTFTVLNPGTPAVFQDNFELSAFPTPPTETDLNLEAAARQVAGTVNSGYTAGGTFLPFIQDNAGSDGSDALVLQTQSGITTSAALVQHDFAPELAGMKYSVTYDGLITESGDVSADSWQSFGVRDIGADFAFPTDSETDFGILFRPNGDWSVNLDGTFIGSGGAFVGTDTGIRPDLAYSIRFDFDETLASPAVTATVDATLGTVVLGTLPLDALGAGTGFENAIRSFSFFGFQGTSTGPGTIDIAIDNLVIDLVTGTPGDFDGDGDVDGADFLLWQRDTSIGDLADWEDNFGFAPAVAATASVPEPATAITLLMGLALVCLITRKR